MPWVVYNLKEKKYLGVLWGEMPGIRYVPTPRYTGDPSRAMRLSDKATAEGFIENPGDEVALEFPI